MFKQSMKYCNVTIKISYLKMYFDNMRGHYMETRIIEISSSILIPYKSFFIIFQRFQINIIQVLDVYKPFYYSLKFNRKKTMKMKGAFLNIKNSGIWKDLLVAIAVGILLITNLEVEGQRRRSRQRTSISIPSIHTKNTTLRNSLCTSPFSKQRVVGQCKPLVCF